MNSGVYNGMPVGYGDAVIHDPNLKVRGVGYHTWAKHDSFERGALRFEASLSCHEAIVPRPPHGVYIVRSALTYDECMRSREPAPLYPETKQARALKG